MTPEQKLIGAIVAQAMEDLRESQRRLRRWRRTIALLMGEIPDGGAVSRRRALRVETLLECHADLRRWLLSDTARELVDLAEADDRLRLDGVRRFGPLPWNGRLARAAVARFLR